MALDEVSIVIPARNASMHLAVTLEAVGAAALLGAEILLVDDGSTDDTASIFVSKSRMWPSSQLISQGWAGLGAARNRGLEAASRPFVMFLDSDDWLYTEGLAILLNLATKSDAPYIRGLEARHTAGQEPAKFVRGRKARVASAPRALLKSFGGTLRSVYRRPFLNDGAIRYPEDLAFAEDLPFAVSVAARGPLFLDTDIPLYSYQMGSPSQLSSPTRPDTWPKLQHAFLACEEAASEADVAVRSALCAVERWYAWRGLPHASFEGRRDTVRALREFTEGATDRLCVPQWRVTRDLLIMSATRIGGSTKLVLRGGKD